MGRFLKAHEVRTCFAEPLTNLAQAFQQTCEQWEQAHKKGILPREDLFLNEATATMGLATLRKLQREISGKLDDAITGIYRYRPGERVAKGRKMRHR